MSTYRLPAPTVKRTNAVDRVTAGIRPGVTRSAVRPRPISPPIRTLESPPALSRRDVLRRWEEAEVWACIYCDASFAPMVVAEMDHITPLAKGGVHEWFNIAPACSSCNRAKSDRDMSEWMTVLTGQPYTERKVTATRRRNRLSAHPHIGFT